MGANIRCIMRAKAPYGQGITKLKVKLTPEQSSTPSLMPETNSVYLTRPTEGTGELMELVGGSVAWNQLVQNGNFADTTGWEAFSPNHSSISASGNVLTLTHTATSNRPYGVTTSVSITSGHKYRVKFKFTKKIDNTDADAKILSVRFSGGTDQTIQLATNVLQNDVVNVDTVITATSANSTMFIGFAGNVATASTGEAIFTLEAVNVTDLTQMLGPTIADYVYSLEQSTAGSGIAWLQQYGYFTEDYYAFSNPTLQSVEATAHVTKDANNTTIATYPLDSDLVLRGIPKLNNGNLYYDGDTYEWDGTVTRNYAEVDLGSLSWIYDTGRFYAPLPNAVPLAGQTAPNAICAKYVAVLTYGEGVNGTFFISEGHYLSVWDSSYNDTSAFATAMSGIDLLYTLIDSAQTTESADPFTAVQTVEDGGTEEFVTTNNVPVGVVRRFANAVPMEGVDSFTVTANDGTSHTYPVTLSEEIYRGYVDMLTGEAVSDMASIAEYNGETISEPWLSSLDVYSAGATPTNGAQVVYPITPEEVTATITGDPSELSGVVSAISTEGTVEWSELSEIGIKCIMKRKNPFQ